MSLIGIIDGGSTKTDFIFTNTQGEVQLRTQTIGFNPLLVTPNEIYYYLQQNQELIKNSKLVNSIYFYGAGAETKKAQGTLFSTFGDFFPNANIKVGTDMMAAAFAAYNDKPTLVGILGTGSNTCFFDGERIEKPNPSLGYILGDEGSGNHIGRSLLKNYFSNKFPNEIQAAFEDKFNLNVESLLETIYQKSSPNAYLAKFATFAVENKKHPFINKIVTDCFQEFFEYQVFPYHKFDYEEINFVGSIAYHFQSILFSVAKENNLMIGKIVQKPIDKLVEYHFKYLIS